VVMMRRWPAERPLFAYAVRGSRACERVTPASSLKASRRRLERSEKYAFS
jgi:hypothetical protein